MRDVRLGLRLEPTLLELATRQAEKEHIKLSQLVRQALIHYLAARA